jgi:hypothetical protein
MVISYGDVNKHQYVGYNSYVKKIQLEGTVKYQQIDVVLNPIQEKLYQTLIYGFDIFTRKELAKLPEQRKIDIKIRYTKAQRILQKWKQDLIFDSLDKFLLSLFPKSSIVKAFANTKGNSPDVSNEEYITFREAGIKQSQIINKLIENNLLPQNFYELA